MQRHSHLTSVKVCEDKFSISVYGHPRYNLPPQTAVNSALCVLFLLLPCDNRQSAETTIAVTTAIDANREVHTFTSRSD
jgi:hypothetical protein